MKKSHAAASACIGRDLRKDLPNEFATNRWISCASLDDSTQTTWKPMISMAKVQKHWVVMQAFFFGLKFVQNSAWVETLLYQHVGCVLFSLCYTRLLRSHTSSNLLVGQF